MIQGPLLGIHSLFGYKSQADILYKNIGALYNAKAIEETSINTHKLWHGKGLSDISTSFIRSKAKILTQSLPNVYKPEKY